MQNHLHPNIEDDDANHISNLAILIGLFGMLLSVSSDFVQIEEMYPHYVKNFRTAYPRENLNWSASLRSCFQEIPLSLWLQWLGDMSLCYYGIATRDVIITIYGALNTSVIVLAILSIQKQTMQPRWRTTPLNDYV